MQQERTEKKLNVFPYGFTAHFGYEDTVMAMNDVTDTQPKHKKRKDIREDFP